MNLLRRLERRARSRSAAAEAALTRMIGSEEDAPRPLSREALRADPALADARERFRAAHRSRCAAADALAAAQARCES